MNTKRKREFKKLRDSLLELQSVDELPNLAKELDYWFGQLRRGLAAAPKPNELAEQQLVLLTSEYNELRRSNTARIKDNKRLTDENKVLRNRIKQAREGAIRAEQLNSCIGWSAIGALLTGGAVREQKLNYEEWLDQFTNHANTLGGELIPGFKFTLNSKDRFLLSLCLGNCPVVGFENVIGELLKDSKGKIVATLDKAYAHERSRKAFQDRKYVLKLKNVDFVAYWDRLKFVSERDANRIPQDKLRALSAAIWPTQTKLLKRRNAASGN